MSRKPICSANASLRAGPRRPTLVNRPTIPQQKRRTAKKNRTIAGIGEKSYRHFWQINQRDAEKRNRNFGLVAAVLDAQHQHVTPFFNQIATLAEPLNPHV